MPIESTIDMCFGCGGIHVGVAESFLVNGYWCKRCATCSSVMTRPLPNGSDLRHFYEGYSDRYSGGMGLERYRREMPKRWASRLDLMRRFGAGRILLDIGGANGMFGALADAAGYNVAIADIVSRHVDLGFAAVRPGDVSQVRGLPFADAQFDVITLWSCLEHLRNPETALIEARRVARKGAILVVDTPLVGDWCERNFGARSHWICPPEHLHLFSSKGLGDLVSRSCWRVLYHAPFQERTYARWALRRCRNMTLALAGFALRAVAPLAWRQGRSGGPPTQAGDIQVLLARAA
jgi:SAM-dependent methyltransferase